MYQSQSIHVMAFIATITFRKDLLKINQVFGLKIGLDGTLFDDYQLKLTFKGSRVGDKIVQQDRQKTWRMLLLDLSPRVGLILATICGMEEQTLEELLVAHF